LLLPRDGLDEQVLELEELDKDAELLEFSSPSPLLKTNTPIQFQTRRRANKPLVVPCGCQWRRRFGIPACERIDYEE
jgi:hypothetical protein